MTKTKLILASLLTTALSLSALSALTINVDYSYDTSSFFGVNERSVVDKVVSDFETRLTFDGGEIAPSGPNTWSYVFNDPSTGNSTSVTNPFLAENSITLYFGAQELAGSTLGQGGNVGFNASGTSTFINSITSRNTTTYYAPTAGTISMDSTADWYVDTSFDPFAAAGKNDLYSVLAHEMLHTFGFGLNTSQLWFENLLVDNGVFATGTEATSLYGANVPMTGDGAHIDSSVTSVYWDGSEFVTQQPSMTSSITVGSRKYLTELDFAFLADMQSFTVNPVPEPSSFSTVLALLALGVCFTRRNTKK